MPDGEQYTTNRRWAVRSLGVGLVFIVVSAPIVVLISGPGQPSDATGVPPAGPDAIEDPVSAVISEGIVTVGTGIANVAVVLLLVGVGLTLFGGLYFGRRYVSGVTELLFRSAVARALWVCVGYTALFAVSPRVRSLSFEVAAVLFASGSVIVTGAAVLRWAESRSGRLTRIVLVGPAILAVVFLSVIAGMLASRTFDTLVVQFTDAFVRFVLLEVLAPVGVNAVLTSAFELEGVAYFLVWVGVTVVGGWVLGLGLTATEE